MRKEVLQRFFRNRGINIPDLNPEKWADAVAGSPVSSRFYRDFLSGRIHYISGTGNTHISFVERGMDFVDVRIEMECGFCNNRFMPVELNSLHDFKIMWEFLEAGLEESHLSDLVGSNIPITAEQVERGVIEWEKSQGVAFIFQKKRGKNDNQGKFKYLP